MATESMQSFEQTFHLNNNNSNNNNNTNVFMNHQQQAASMASAAGSAAALAASNHYNHSMSYYYHPASSDYAQHHQFMMDPYHPTSDFRPTFYNPFEIKHRRRTSRAQLKILEKAFLENAKPNATVRRYLAQQLDMTPRGVQIWFQNRRAKAKLQNKKKSQQHMNSSSSSNSMTDASPSCSVTSSPNDTLIMSSDSTNSFLMTPPLTTATSTNDNGASLFYPIDGHHSSSMDSTWFTHPLEMVTPARRQSCPILTNSNHQNNNNNNQNLWDQSLVVPQQNRRASELPANEIMNWMDQDSCCSQSTITNSHWSNLDKTSSTSPLSDHTSLLDLYQQTNFKLSNTSSNTLDLYDLTTATSLDSIPSLTQPIISPHSNI